MQIEMRVAAVKPSRSKGYLVLTLSDGIETSCYTLREEEYSIIGSPLRGAELSFDALSSLTLYDEGYRARIFALRSLSLTDSSERALARKLAMRGIRPTVVEAVVREMVSLGYINESDQLYRLALYAANHDLYGPRRIVAKLTSKGFSSADIRRTLNLLVDDGSIDFKRNSAELLEKKLTRGASSEEKKKLLYKYGY